MSEIVIDASQINEELLKTNIQLQNELNYIVKHQLTKRINVVNPKTITLRDSIHPKEYFPDYIRYDFDRYYNNALFAYFHYLKQEESFAISGAIRYLSSMEAPVSSELLLFNDKLVSLRQDYWM